MADRCFAEAPARLAERQSRAPLGAKRTVPTRHDLLRRLFAQQLAGGGPPPAPAAAPAPAPAAAPAAALVAPPPMAVAPPALAWDMQKTHKSDDLWHFCGEHPSGFSTAVRLKARGFTNPVALAWKITAGASRVKFSAPPSGSEVRVESKAGSAHANDVSVEVREGAGPAAPSFTGHLSVLKPHRLLMRGAPVDVAGSPPWNPAPAGVPGFWTRIGYRVVDNLGGTVVGATVNENFPGAKLNDQPNNWVAPAGFGTVPFWENTNGTFVDNWYEWGGAPAPVAPGDPTAGQSVDRMNHEFYVGSRTPARGCRVQQHVAHRYLGRARHEGIVSPAP